MIPSPVPPSRLSRSVLPWIASVSLLGCTSTTDTQAIGPEGGTLTAGDVSLVIPPGALAEEVELGLELVSDLVDAGYAAAPDILDGDPLVSVALTPHGTTFAEPLTLSLPIGDLSDEQRAELALLHLPDAESAEWGSVGPLALDGEVARIEIRGFSVYSLATVAAGTCPCWTGSVVRDFVAYGRTTSWSRHLGPTGTPSASLRYVRDLASGGDLAALAIRVRTVVTPPGSTTTPPGACVTVVHGPEATGSQWLPSAPLPLVAGQVLLSDGSTAPSWSASVPGMPPSQVLSCGALLRASADGEPAVEIGYAATGLPAGQTVVVGAPSGESITLSVDGEFYWASGVIAPATTYASEILAQPASAICVLGPNGSGVAASENIGVELSCGPVTPEACNGLDDDGDGQVDEGFDVDSDSIRSCGADGTPGNADDDCHDGDATIHPGATEACEGVDSDCDGSTFGELTDVDSDGTMDACDPTPADGCGAFTVAEVELVAAVPGAICLIDDTSTVPAVDLFSGVYIDHGQGVWEIAGVGTTFGPPEAWFSGFGCDDSGATGATTCAGIGRPAIAPAVPFSQLEHDNCRHVALEGCP